MFGVVRDATLADDVSQEVWLRVLKYRHQFRGECRMSTWLHRIAVNCALRAIDDRNRLAERPLTTGTRGTRFDGRLCERLVVDERAARLPAQMRRILILHAILGYKHEEIAERLGISAGASRSQLWHARRRLTDTDEVAA